MLDSGYIQLSPECCLVFVCCSEWFSGWVGFFELITCVIERTIEIRSGQFIINP